MHWFLPSFILFLVFYSEGRITIIAHRGSSGDRPEETEGAYHRAAQVDADYLESDLCSTRDGKVVLIHDCELSDTTNIAEFPEFKDRFVFSEYFNSSGFFTENFDLTEIKKLTTFQRLEVRSQEWNGIYRVLKLEEYLGKNIKRKV